MIVGQPFKPHGLFLGAFVPVGIMAYAGKAGTPPKSLSDGAKLLYGLLSYRGGKTGEFPTVDRLGRDLGGASNRTVSRYASELTVHGFLRVVPGHREQPNRYIFLWHPCLNGSLRKNPIPRDAEEPEPPPERSPNLSTLDNEKGANSDYLSGGKVASSDTKGRQKKAERSPNLSTPYKEEENKENIEEISSSQSQSETALAVLDDDPKFSDSQNQNSSDRKKIIAELQRVLRCARAESANRPLQEIEAPDEWITSQIFGVFTHPTDVEKWVQGTIKRGLGRKATSAQWGLWLTDARNQETQLRLDRAAREESAARIQANLSAAAATKAEADRVRNAPVPAGQAIDALMAEDVRIPFPLKAKLLRTNEYVSPNELRRQAAAWKTCRDCSDSGKLGSAIDRDLRWCACPAGVEYRIRDGEDWPASQIALVHASVKSLLAAAACEGDSQFTADVLLSSSIADDGAVVTVTVPHTHRHFFGRDPLWAEVRRIGLERSVRIVVSSAA